jgi:hypothetical protein
MIDEVNSQTPRRMVVHHDFSAPRFSLMTINQSVISSQNNSGPQLSRTPIPKKYEPSTMCSSPSQKQLHHRNNADFEVMGKMSIKKELILQIRATTAKLRNGQQKQTPPQQTELSSVRSPSPLGCLSHRSQSSQLSSES